MCKFLVWQISIILHRVNRSYGEVDRLVHRRFNEYLFERRRGDTNICTYGKRETGDMEHTLFLCLRWEEPRVLLNTETSWNAAYNAVKPNEGKSI